MHCTGKKWSCPCLNCRIYRQEKRRKMPSYSTSPSRLLLRAAWPALTDPASAAVEPHI